ncbi:MAG: hypothetical protein WAW75_02930 [Gallionella sp.]
MSIYLRGAGGWAAGQTSIATSIPAGTVAGDMMLLFIGGKQYDETITDPSGWTLLSAGSGANGTVAMGLDTGSVVWKVYYREFVAGDTGPTITTDGNVNIALIKSYKKTKATWVTPVAAKGSDTSSGTSLSMTMDADVGIIAGDMICHFACKPSDAGTMTVPTITATSATFGTVLNLPVTNASTLLGNDFGGASSEALCTAGTATAAAVCGWTITANTGGGCIVRLRESGSESGVSILDDIRAFWPMGDPFTSSKIADRSIYGNSLDTHLKINQCTLPFRMGANSAIDWYSDQQVFGSLKGWGKWDRLLTSGEKSALAGGEYWPFSTTTTLQNAKVYYLLDEAGGSGTYTDATGRGNDLTSDGNFPTTRDTTGPNGAGDNATTLSTSSDICSCTASTTADVLTVTAVALGTIAIGMRLYAPSIGMVTAYFITSFITGSGGIGTYGITAGLGTHSSRGFTLWKDITLTKTSPSTDLQSGPSSMTIAGWVKINNKFNPYSSLASQQVFWGQLVNDFGGQGVTESGFNVYYDPTANRFCIDIDAGDGQPLSAGSVTIDTVLGIPTSNTWYFVLLEFDRENNQAKLQVNNGAGNTNSPILQPTPVAGKVGDGSQFILNTAFSFATRTTGWDVPPPVNGNCYADLPPNSDLSFGANSKVAWGWFKATDYTTYQTLGGFYDGTAAGTDWIIQISASNLYFVCGLQQNYIAIPLTDTNWHFFIAWFDATSGLIYFNLDGATYTVRAIGPTTPQTVSNNFRLGSDSGNGGSDHQFKGILDAWGIANGNPLDSDIAALWNGGSGWELANSVAKIYQANQAVNRAGTY